MDQNKFINAYIDIIIGQLHEMLSNNLQLKTQVKLANDLLQEKEQFIANLQNQLNAVQSNDEDVRKSREQAKFWEDSYHAMNAKVSHMDTLLKQISEMKTMIQERDKLIESLQTPKKVINTKAKKVVEQQIENPTDDF